MHRKLAEEILANLPKGFKSVFVLPSFELISDPGLVPPDRWILYEGKDPIGEIPTEEENAIYLNEDIAERLAPLFKELVRKLGLEVEIKTGCSIQYMDYLKRVYGNAIPSWMTQ